MSDQLPLRQALDLLEEASSYTSGEAWSPSLTDEINSFVVNTRAALAAAPQVPAVPQWRPIETAPTDTLVLLYGAKRSEMVVGMKHSRDGWVIDTPSEWAGMYPPTHWMKLPAAPGAPQPAEPAPLTVPQILELMPDKVPASYDGQMIEFARAIEAAHGIGAAGVKEPNADITGGTPSGFMKRLGV